MPQGTTFLLGRRWPSAEALKGKMWEVRCELLSLGQRDGMSLEDSTSKGSHQPEQGWAASGSFCAFPAIPVCTGSFSCVLFHEMRILGYPERFCPAAYTMKA